MRTPSPVGKVKKGSPAPSLSVIGAHHLLYGDSLEDVGEATLIVNNGIIEDTDDGITSPRSMVFDIIMPLPVNAHVHLNDYRVPEACIGLSLSGYVGRKGIKHPLIRLYKEPLIANELTSLLIMYSLIVDFQEIHESCNRLREVLGQINTGYVGLSRPSSWDSTSEEELFRIAEECGGIGVSNPTVVPPWLLPVLAEISRRHHVSAHVSETRIMEERGGLHYLMAAGIRMHSVIHGVFLEDWELRLLADEKIILVVNPRSNLWFTGRTARVDRLVEYGGLFAIGSDNAGCFHPDLFVEAETLYTLYPSLDPRIIVSALTINGYRSVGIKPKTIVKGSEAFLLALDLGLPGVRSRNIYASIIRRGSWARRMLVFKKDSQYMIEKTIAQY